MTDHLGYKKHDPAGHNAGQIKFLKRRLPGLFADSKVSKKKCPYLSFERYER